MKTCSWGKKRRKLLGSDWISGPFSRDFVSQMHKEGFFFPQFKGKAEADFDTTEVSKSVGV